MRTVMGRRTRWAVWAVVLLAGAARAEDAPAKIRDNLFLLEEAYNQEPGVIQHIQSFVFEPKSKDWSYSFTEEWPAPTDRNQLSITVPALRIGTGANAEAAIGDVMLNYRVQAMGLGGVGRLAIAPRLSLTLPTGDYRTGAGRGALGVQLNLPVSLELGDHLVSHLNAGVTVTPAARAPGGYSQTAVDANAGLALVWLLAPWLNPLVEVVYLSGEEIRDDLTTARSSTVVINPGVRAAITFRNGLQIVPGLSAPIQLAETGVSFSVLAYLSFEHPLWDPPDEPR